MKLHIEKRAVLTIDTQIERNRIKKAFRSKYDKEMRENLLTLMDLIESGEWKLAEKTLENKWWLGFDTKYECDRLEFIGMIRAESPHWDNWLTYRDLVYMMANFPDNYKVIGTQI